MKLLRPLHRQRKSRPIKFEVLGNQDLAAFHGVQLADLEDHLQRQGLPFHKDSCGNLWASCARPTSAA